MTKEGGVKSISRYEGRGGTPLGCVIDHGAFFSPLSSPLTFSAPLFSLEHSFAILAPWPSAAALFRLDINYLSN